MLALASHLISTLIGVFIGIYRPRINIAWAIRINHHGFWASHFFLGFDPLLAGIHDRLAAFCNFNSPQFAFAPWSWGKFVDTLSHVWPVIVIAGLGRRAELRVMRGNAGYTE